jgi:ketosteroid isomerase-like protein
MSENVEIVRRSVDAYNRGDLDGIEVQARAAWLITFRDGEQTSLTLYQTKKEALQDAGLRE